MQATSQEGDPFLVRFLPGTSPAVVRMREQVEALNSTRNLRLCPVILLEGESGAGKTYYSQVIAGHRRWRTQSASGEALGLQLDAYLDRYAAANLPALPEGLIESELFGHMKGSFTGANKDKPGLLGGPGSTQPYDDVLLDEIGDASRTLQAKLLRVIEHRKFRTVGAGDEDEYETSARLILATNQDLEALVAARTFREDLYWRISAYVVQIPALREQPENIEAIAREILAREQGERPTNLTADDPEALTFTAKDMAWAKEYLWPGNVRELEHAIRRWLASDGRRPFFEVARREPPRFKKGGVPVALDLASTIRQRLDAALQDGTAVANQIGDLPQEYTDHVKHAIHAWWKQTKPPRERLKTLFPGHGNVDSIINRISEWKPA